MPLNAKALGEALHENLTLHSTLCRRDAGAFQRAIQSGEPVVVACTQEQRLFADLGQQTEGALSPIRFVNIRETGGWSRDAGKASPKIAALLAAAHLPEPAPVPTVTFKSAGRLLIIGALDAAEQAAALVSDVTRLSSCIVCIAGCLRRLRWCLSGCSLQILKQIEVLDILKAD